MAKVQQKFTIEVDSLVELSWLICTVGGVCLADFRAAATQLYC